jgi:quinoprotein glucose dehydrogenase
VRFIGHDLHGLHFGPDGKLYFSIGDRGSNLKLEDGRTLGEPDTGCVFRCNADGSDIEIFATGLRNPQDLVFDEYGNLFTGDNNSDSGDKARWVYLVEGGDSGWRVGYQFLDSPYSRGPFNEEKLWYPQFEGQAAYIVPPITNIASGPSGLAYFPGTGLPSQYKGHFFLVDFRGAGANSGVHTFRLKPEGASFEVVEPEQFIWGVLPTDVKFGVDGGAYLTDWVAGWEMPGKGRIYRIHDPTVDKSKLVLETKRILAEGMEKKATEQVIDFLDHPDMRVRQEAQFELASRGEKATRALISVANKKEHQLARLHAIWALGQIAGDRQAGHLVSSRILQNISSLLLDSDIEVRCQAAKLVGEQRWTEAYGGLIKLMADPNPRVRFFATMSLGKLGLREAMPAILTLLRENNDKDAYLRHAGVMALSRLNNIPVLLNAVYDESSAVRRAALLALRKLHRNEIALFLQDSDPTIVLEAARAINDEPINGAMPELASLIKGFTTAPSNFTGPAGGSAEVPLIRRVLNANFRLGTSETAKVLAAFAALTSTPEPMRVEALEELGDWEHPSGRDRVMGLWRPVAGSRQRAAAADALQPMLKSLLASAPDSIRIAALKAVKRLAIDSAALHVLELVKNSKLPGPVRAEALQTLGSLSGAEFREGLKYAETDTSEDLRKAATLLRGKQENAAQSLTSTLERGTVGEKQTAFKALGELKDSAADDVLGHWLDELTAARVPMELQLDVLEAAAKRSRLKEKVAKYRASKAQDDPLAEFSEVLSGGQAEQGKTIFFERPDAQCVRCHKINGKGGDVGPDLSHIGAQKDRKFLLESVVLPIRQISQGFESILVTYKNGEVYAGVLKSETAEQLVINSPDRGLLTLKKSDIESRQKSLSPMPEGMGQILSKFDLRNLVEFLSTLK